MDDGNDSRSDGDIPESIDILEVKTHLLEFNKNPSNKFPPMLENYLKSIAKTGKTRLDWSDVRVFLSFKMDSVMRQSDSSFSMDSLGKFPNVENVSFGILHQRILERFMTFNAAPFTIQRLCELLTVPKKHYKRSDKLLRGIEKNVMVVSCVDNDGNKLSHEPPPITDTQYLNMLCGSTPRPAPVPSPSSQHGTFKPPSPVAHSPRSDKQPVGASCSSATPWSSPTTGQKTRQAGDETEPPVKQSRFESSDSSNDAPTEASSEVSQSGSEDGSGDQLPVVSSDQSSVDNSACNELPDCGEVDGKQCEVTSGQSETSETAAVNDDA